MVEILADNPFLVDNVSSKELAWHVPNIFDNLDVIANQFYDGCKTLAETRRRRHGDSNYLNLASFISDEEEKNGDLTNRLNSVIESIFDKLSEHPSNNVVALKRVKDSLISNMSDYSNAHYEAFMADVQFENALRKERGYMIICGIIGFSLPTAMVVAHSAFANHGMPNANLSYYNFSMISGVVMGVVGSVVGQMYSSSRTAKYIPKKEETTSKRIILRETLIEKALSVYLKK